MIVHPAAGRLVAWVPAKLNLFFEVLSKRADGFHEVETLMCPIDLFDRLSLADDPTGRLTLSCRWTTGALLRAGCEGIAANHLGFGALPVGAENLVIRAVERLRQHAGVERGAQMTLTKRIPAEAGLGGGSSDAAAALVLANQAWNLNWPRERLAEVASELGSDVAFFLLGKAAMCRGRGEQIEPLAQQAPFHFVVVRPPQGLSTAAVYRSCSVPPKLKSSDSAVRAFASGDLRQIARSLHNALQPAAEQLSPWIQRLKNEFARTDCVAHQMSGSGSSYFGICRHARHARHLALKLRARRVGSVYVARSYETPLATETPMDDVVPNVA